MKVARQRTAMSEINVTPLVDVMLVLLIIFMVTAPLLQQGVDVNLPKAKGKDMPTEERITVVIRKGGAIFLNDNPVSMQQLVKRLSAASKQNPNVFLKADRDVPYGLIAEVMGEIKEAGIEKLGLVTEPKMSLQ
ncbi:MAG TPA: protein TolR [Dissulfurispiraceae bacterium]|jgi:biopolymer transport protein TolR|nr:protein TolR [Dissulfurispiraceae bacterium]